MSIITTSKTEDTGITTTMPTKIENTVVNTQNSETNAALVESRQNNVDIPYVVDNSELELIINLRAKAKREGISADELLERLADNLTSKDIADLKAPIIGGPKYEARCKAFYNCQKYTPLSAETIAKYCEQIVEVYEPKSTDPIRLYDPEKILKEIDAYQVVCLSGDAKSGKTMLGCRYLAMCYMSGMPIRIITNANVCLRHIYEELIKELKKLGCQNFPRKQDIGLTFCKISECGNIDCIDKIPRNAVILVDEAGFINEKDSGIAIFQMIHMDYHIIIAGDLKQDESSPWYTTMIANAENCRDFLSKCGDKYYQEYLKYNEYGHYSNIYWKIYHTGLTEEQRTHFIYLETSPNPLHTRFNGGYDSVVLDKIELNQSNMYLFIARDLCNKYSRLLQEDLQEQLAKTTDIEKMPCINKQKGFGPLYPGQNFRLKKEDYKNHKYEYGDEFKIARISSNGDKAYCLNLRTNQYVEFKEAEYVNFASTKCYTSVEFQGMRTENPVVVIARRGSINAVRLFTLNTRCEGSINYVILCKRDNDRILSVEEAAKYLNKTHDNCKLTDKFSVFFDMIIKRKYNATRRQLMKRGCINSQETKCKKASSKGRKVNGYNNSGAANFAKCTQINGQTDIKNVSSAVTDTSSIYIENKIMNSEETVATTELESSKVPKDAFSTTESPFLQSLVNSVYTEGTKENEKTSTVRETEKISLSEGTTNCSTDTNISSINRNLEENCLSKETKSSKELVMKETKNSELTGTTEISSSYKKSESMEISDELEGSLINKRNSKESEKSSKKAEVFGISGSSEGSSITDNSSLLEETDNKKSSEKTRKPKSSYFKRESVSLAALRRASSHSKKLGVLESAGLLNQETNNSDSYIYRKENIDNDKTVGRTITAVDISDNNAFYTDSSSNKKSSIAKKTSTHNIKNIRRPAVLAETMNIPYIYQFMRLSRYSIKDITIRVNMIMRNVDNLGSFNVRAFIDYLNRLGPGFKSRVNNPENIVYKVIWKKMDTRFHKKPLDLKISYGTLFYEFLSGNYTNARKNLQKELEYFAYFCVKHSDWLNKLFGVDDICKYIRYNVLNKYDSADNMGFYFMDYAEELRKLKTIRLGIVSSNDAYFRRFFDGKEQPVSAKKPTIIAPAAPKEIINNNSIGEFSSPKEEDDIRDDYPPKQLEYIDRSLGLDRDEYIARTYK